MKKFLIILLTAIILVLGGFFILNLFFGFTDSQTNEKETVQSVSSETKETTTASSEEFDSVKDTLKKITL
ncbi:MAG: beta-hexosaminidase, partial [Enterococcus sp.]